MCLVGCWCVLFPFCFLVIPSFWCNCLFVCVFCFLFVSFSPSFWCKFFFSFSSSVHIHLDHFFCFCRFRFRFRLLLFSFFLVAATVLQGGTEPSFTSRLNGEKRDGDFLCAGCGQELFRSNSKYNSGTGWWVLLGGGEWGANTSVDGLVLTRQGLCRHNILVLVWGFP